MLRNLIDMIAERDDLIEGVHYEIGDNGKPYPIVRGGAAGDEDEDDDGDEDEDADDDSDEDDDDGEGDEDEDEEDLIPQSEVNKIAAKEKRDGRRSERAKILKDLGVKSLDEAKRKMSGSKPKKKAGEDEDETDDTSEQDTHDRALDRVHGKAERLLLRAGADDDEGLLAGLITMLDIDSDSDDSDITTAVDELKEERPALFDKTEPKPKTRPRGSDAGRGKRRTKASPDDKAREMLERRHGKISQ